MHEGHTDTPWTVEPYDSETLEVMGPKKQHIGFCPNTRQGHWDAYLIANAPMLLAQRDRLLAALKNMMRIYSDERPRDFQDPGWGQTRPGQYAEEANTAIHEAEITLAT